MLLALADSTIVTVQAIVFWRSDCCESVSSSIFCAQSSRSSVMAKKSASSMMLSYRQASVKFGSEPHRRKFSTCGNRPPSLSMTVEERANNNNKQAFADQL